MRLMKILRILVVVAVVAAMTSAVNSLAPAAPAVAQDTAQDMPQEVALAARIAGAKNVILFVGDGMGLSTVNAARIRQGQLEGRPGEGDSLRFERFPTIGLARTYSFDEQVTDSAASMTALMSGAKTDRGLINIGHDATRGDCSTIAGNELTSWIMESETMGLATGVVTTARLSHATPAAVYAVSIDRGFETDADLPPGCSQPDIARQLIEFPYGDGLEVALGGGRRSFTPTSLADPEDAATAGLRTDGRNLAAEWSARPNSEYVWNRADLAAIDPSTTDHLLGLFSRGHMAYETDRADDVAGEPSLTEMTEAAIEILSQDPDGFALVVEAGRIDHAHHANNAYRALAETIELSNAVNRAAELASLKETLIVVTGDHGHSLTISGYSSRGNDILGLADIALGSDGLPITVLSYATGSRRHLNPDGSRVDLSAVDTTDPDFRQPALLPTSGSHHTGEDIPVYAIGPRRGQFGGVSGQGKIGRRILAVLRANHNP